MMNKAYLVVLISLMVFGCSTFNSKQAPVKEAPMVEAPVVQPTVEEKKEEASESMIKYSEMNNMAPPSDRNYKRMTRERMEEEAELQASAGSLWVMEGQTSYLFSQNKHRQTGDPTAIKMEGAALKFVEGKVSVIVDLLKDLEQQKIEAEAKKKEDDEAAEKEKIRIAESDRLKKETNGKMEEDPTYDPFAGQYPVDPAVASRGPAAKKEDVKSKEERVDLKEIDQIPSRIVEKTKDGMYRIRGQQYLTIKKRPYRVIATALVRAEDFNDGFISSNKLLDPQYDVIHVKRTE